MIRPIEDGDLPELCLFTRGYMMGMWGNLLFAESDRFKESRIVKMRTDQHLTGLLSPRTLTLFWETRNLAHLVGQWQNPSRVILWTSKSFYGGVLYDIYIYILYNYIYIYTHIDLGDPQSSSIFLVGIFPEINHPSYWGTTLATGLHHRQRVDGTIRWPSCNDGRTGGVPNKWGFIWWFIWWIIWWIIWWFI